MTVSTALNFLGSAWHNEGGPAGTDTNLCDARPLCQQGHRVSSLRLLKRERSEVGVSKESLARTALGGTNPPKSTRRDEDHAWGSVYLYKHCGWKEKMSPHIEMLLQCIRNVTKTGM